MSIRLSLFFACLFGVAGCVAHRATTFVLSAPAAPSVGIPAAPNSGPRLEVRNVTVPAYLGNNNILLHRGRQDALADSTARWLEPLSQGMTHALAAGLAARLPEDSIVGVGLILVPKVTL
jgi:uncharacterized lipoprotein YmbA